MFVGEFVKTVDDDESGYAEALRQYYFKPSIAWHGIKSDDVVTAVMFIPTPSENAPPPLPSFSPGQKVFVVVDLDGMSGSMPVIQQAIAVERAQTELAGLGAPCWSRD